MQRVKRYKTWLMALVIAVALAPVCSGLATLLGLPLFPANYPWNQNISQAPVATNSAAFIAFIGGAIGIHPDWGDDNPTNGTSPLYGIPYNVVHGNSTAKINVIIDDYPDQSDLVPVPIPTNAVIEGDYQNGPNTNGPGYNPGQRGDSHLIVWDEDNNIGYELYGAARPSDTNTIDEVPHTDGLWHAAQESLWNFNMDSFRALGETSADAAGLSILAGLARPDEGLPVSQGGQGAINHALRMTIPNADINRQYVYPASHMISEGGIIPMGTRLRLKNTATVNNLIATMGPQAQIIARAMQQYGLILADAGSAMFVTGTSASENATNGISLVWDMSDVLGLKMLTASNFDVVSLRPIVTGLSATKDPVGSALTINGQNFSGAAGNLSVFFGTNAAAGLVNVLSDTQLSVTVPGGSGTVDVTIQSGTNETDTISDSTNANVNAPIFGYGVSALTLSDKFTYVPAVPTIRHVALSGGDLIMSGTNNSGPGGTYHVLTTTNLHLPQTNWMVLSNGSFDSSGNFSFTNPIAPANAQLFYTLEVP